MIGNKKNMKAIAIVLLSVFFIGIVLMGGYAQESEEKSTSVETETTTALSEKIELTAQEAFHIAHAVAAEWASDAVLVDLSNFRGTSLSNGRSVRWKIEFNSASMDKELEVHVSRGKILQTMEEKFKKREAITGAWIDTPKALDISFGYFVDKPVDNYWFGISSKEGIATWYIKCDYSEGIPTWVDINALTGEVIKTREGY
ncbi:MAG: hypothetical protein JXC36_08895 [Candidatus Atribacteria bacterium]|nr:hypothetical protein [Candidatus Atribacteria bacterium]